MSVVCVSGIVTRYTNYRDNDRILSIFTIDRGRIDAKARGCRRPASPLLSVAQPFVYGEFELYAAKDKYTVNQATVTESFFPIREDIIRYAAASSMLQLVHEAAQEGEPNRPLFSLLYHALSFLSYGEMNTDDLMLCFLAKYLQAIGYCPSITVCGQCGRDIRGDAHVYFSPHAGGAVCAACRIGAREVSKTALEAIRRMLLLSDDQMQRVKLTDKLRAELLHMLPAQVEHSLDYGVRALSFYTGLAQSTTEKRE